VNLNNLFVDSFSLHFGPVKASRCLLAVSGGIDSMAMLDLFRQAGMQIGVAHCNFALRGDESDKDNELVKQYCIRHSITFYEKRFDTEAFATEQKVSIQMAARTLRYAWFEELAIAHSYHFIATAHHQNDNAETILMNIIRGTGLNGLSGIPVVNGNIIRPLLFATRAQLETYIIEQGITYREDASNSENKYARNKIRNEIIPALQSINPETIAHLNALGEYAGVAYDLLQIQVAEIRSKYVLPGDAKVHIHMKDILMHKHASFFVFELLKEYGFNTTQVREIIAVFSRSTAGKLFYSNSHQLLIDRDTIIVSPGASEVPDEIVVIDAHINQQINIGKQLYTFEYLPIVQFSSFQKNHIYLDAALIALPFTIRRWKRGDRFLPLGMNGAKKVSDFLIDEKINLIDKQDVFVLESEGNIAAILNHRTSEAFKISPQTNCILHIHSI
jgi:tRNA(Ile)-lysidine synthase